MCKTSEIEEMKNLSDQFRDGRKCFKQEILDTLERLGVIFYNVETERMTGSNRPYLEYWISFENRYGISIGKYGTPNIYGDLWDIEVTYKSRDEFPSIISRLVSPDLNPHCPMEEEEILRFCIRLSRHEATPDHLALSKTELERSAYYRAQSESVLHAIQEKQ